MRGLRQLYIETAPIIYFVENRAGYADKVEAVLLSAKQSPLLFSTSVITLTEALNKPIKANDVTLIKAYLDLLLHTRNFSALPVNVTIAEQAAKLRATYHLRTPTLCIWQQQSNPPAMHS